jgi:hypothetical protein
MYVPVCAMPAGGSGVLRCEASLVAGVLPDQTGPSVRVPWSLSKLDFSTTRKTPMCAWSDKYDSRDYPNGVKIKQVHHSCREARQLGLEGYSLVYSIASSTALSCVHHDVIALPTDSNAVVRRGERRSTWTRSARVALLEAPEQWLPLVDRRLHQ